jgi:hypothetical protein
MVHWDWERNEVDPKNILPDSNKSVHWICINSLCEHPHRWTVSPANKKGCPRCCNHNVCEYGCDSFGKLFPDLLTEWDWEENDKLELNPFKIARSSNVKVHWKCTKGECGHHKWSTSPNKRTTMERGCPFCAGNKTCICTSFPMMSPELYKEWHPTKNTIDPYNIRKSSSYVVWWCCSKCSYEWQASLNTRDGYLGRGCPKCAYSKGESIIDKYLTNRGIEHKPYVVKIKGNIHEFDFMVIVPYGPWYIILIIEFDGEQHFKDLPFFHKKQGRKSFESRHVRDLDKDEWCRLNNIPFLRIPYTKMAEIESILDDMINNIGYHQYVKLLSTPSDYYTSVLTK